MEPPDDRTLLRQYAENHSDEAFGGLVARHINLVYSVALRQANNPQHAEEIAQAVFVILAQKAPALRHHEALSSWLFQTARLTASNFVRSEMRRRRREQEASMQSVLDESENQLWERIAPLLDTAVADLNEQDRRAIVLRFYEGRNLREVGVALGANEEAARKRVNRAVEKLQKFFQKNGVASTAEAIAGVISTNSVQAAPAMLAKAVTTLALAKSAAASTSTLTLIKGALKLMAWTKTKTAVAVAVMAVLGAGTTLLTIKTLQAGRVARLNALHDIQGIWEGDTSTGGAGINRGESFRNRMVLKLSRSNRDYAATADYIDLGRTNLPVAVDYAYPSLRLTINPQVIMDGKVNVDATKLNFRGFALLRTNSPDAVPGELAPDAFAPRAGSELQGYWKGTIGAQPDPLPLNWRIAGQADGTFRAELDNPNEGALGQPATVAYRRPAVQLILASRNGMFQGEINGDNTEIRGSWIQAGQATPASFQRSDYAADHAQDPLKDYSFHSDND